MVEPLVPSENFVATLAVNVDNINLSDKDFRQMVRNSLPVVIFDRFNKETYPKETNIG